ncbi:AMP-binding protein [Fibrella sp. WM1]|uniref:AMP-binding protein n=1 Tax=Fibrella musci TaxID=3242485 RepID=UPI0035223D0B
MTFTLLDKLAQHATQTPNKRAYSFETASPGGLTSLTFGDLHRRAMAVGLQLATLDDTNLLLMFPAGLEFIVAFLGCLYAGKVAVPLPVPSTRDKHNRIGPVVNDAATRTVLTNAAVIQACADTNRLAELDSRDLRFLDIQTLQETAPTASADYERTQHRAFLQYTSGSTGTPKGVMVTRRNLDANLADLAENAGFDSTCTMVTWLPMFHDMGLVAGIMLPMYCGATCVVMSPLDFMVSPMKWLMAITTSRGTHSVAPNFAFDLCLAKITDEQLGQLDLSSLRYLGNCAEPVRDTTLVQFNERFAKAYLPANVLKPGYGMAETTLKITATHRNEAYQLLRVNSRELAQNTITLATSNDSDSVRLVGCGRVPEHTQVRIVDPATLAVCSDDQVGEIWVKSDSVAEGYFNNPIVSQQLFGAYCGEPQEGPFLRTGDLGFLHRNQLFVTGRLKDMMKIRGRSLYPQDLEWTSQAVSPHLKSAAVFLTDKAQPGVCIVQEVALNRVRPDDYDALTVSIQQAVAQMHGVEVDQVVLLKSGVAPKTSSGKIRRDACRTRLLNDELEVVYRRWFTTQPQPTTHGLLMVSSPSVAVAPVLLAAVRAMSGLDTLTDDQLLDQSIYKLGIDSLSAVRLLHRLEDQLQRPIPAEWLLASPTIRAFCQQLTDQPEAQPIA